MWEQNAVRIDATQNHAEAHTLAHTSLYQWLLTREAMSTHQHPRSASTFSARVAEAELKRRAHLCTRVVPDTKIFELHFMRVLIINFIHFRLRAPFSRIHNCLRQIPIYVHIRTPCMKSENGGDDGSISATTAIQG